jgi:hypothetical protein
MTARTKLRLIALVSGAFMILGLALVVVSIQVRRYFSPTPGILIGLIVMLISSAASVQLWRSGKNAAVLFGTAGVGAAGMVFIAPWLFPLVQATSELPSFFELYAFVLVPVLILALVIPMTWLAHRSLRRSIEGR